MALSSRQHQEHERATFFLEGGFGYLNDCYLKNIDETVPSIVITTARRYLQYCVTLCSFVSLFSFLFFFFKELLHDLSKMPFHSVYCPN